MAKNNYIGLILDDKYRLTNLLGQGGMGAVYCGEHLVLKKKVAIKFLQPGFGMEEQLVKRFYREAQAAAAIGHEGIIDVMDVGVAPSNEPYLVMEYLEGESLGQLLSRSTSLSIPAACAVMAPALQALHAAHTKGIVHRDLKPENIFLCYTNGKPPRIKLIDFGISKIMAAPENEKLTQTGSIIGTPAYMSPEQARGNSNVDHRTDIFSMGVIFYQMVTGKLPFPGESSTDILVKIITGDPVPPTEVISDFSANTESIIMTALAKNPVDRYADALRFLSVLEQLPGYADGQSALTSACARVANPTCASDTPLPSAVSRIENEMISGSVGGTSGMSVRTAGWTASGTRQGVASANENRRRAVPVLVAVILLLLIVGGATIFLMRTSDAVSVQTPVQNPRDEKLAPKGPREILIATRPDGAAVLIEGARVGDTPVKVTVNGDTNVLIQKDGFAPQAVLLSPASDPNLIVQLIPLNDGAQRDAEKSIGDMGEQGATEEKVSVAAEGGGGEKTAATAISDDTTRLSPGRSRPSAESTSKRNTSSAANASSTEPPSTATGQGGDLPSSGHSANDAGEAAASPSDAAVRTPQKRTGYDNMRDLKSDYRAGLVTKAEYKVHQLRIRALRQVEYDEQKKLYRDGKITKAEYEYRVEQIHAKYEGKL